MEAKHFKQTAFYAEVPMEMKKLFFKFKVSYYLPILRLWLFNKIKKLNKTSTSSNNNILLSYFFLPWVSGIILVLSKNNHFRPDDVHDRMECYHVLVFAQLERFGYSGLCRIVHKRLVNAWLFKRSTSCK